ncbi:methyltransferase domain protein [Dictyocaulus viviparus]|uniref:Arginine-hydroxylase NDUFAF5, mitochondrial n=1 Tax=Dictyocaulus viviparus TaxID=29172 RepID=A0A0D8Y5A9_DICVI|nr:methyltransferase domain protein [Dictyocaulus viviparus]
MAFHRILCCFPSTSAQAIRFLSTEVTSAPAKKLVFDRQLKRRQRDWAAYQPDFEDAQYLKEEIGWRVADRVFDLTKFNPLALDIGCGIGNIAPHMIKENVGTLIQCDMSENMVVRSKESEDKEVLVERVVCDEEKLEPFRPNQFDLLLSSLSAHWINDLPHCFVAFEICPSRIALYYFYVVREFMFITRLFNRNHKELERLGGVGSHISPFIKPHDIGSLLHSAGFQMITLDNDEVEVGYPNMLALLHDLQLMAESHCTFSRSRTIRRDILIAADAIYKAIYAKEGRYPATFRVISFIGWKPGPETPKPAKRGSQNISFKDLDKVAEDPQIMQNLSKKRDDSKTK